MWVRAWNANAIAIANATIADANVNAYTNANANARWGVWGNMQERAVNGAQQAMGSNSTPRLVRTGPRESD